MAATMLSATIFLLFGGWRRVMFSLWDTMHPVGLCGYLQEGINLLLQELSKSLLHTLA
jgi:hypothetical protein